jgi:hypothetical protein
MLAGEKTIFLVASKDAVPVGSAVLANLRADKYTMSINIPWFAEMIVTIRI